MEKQASTKQLIYCHKKGKSSKITKFPQTMLKTLKDFRKAAYTLLENGKDAVMDLMDAVLVTRSAKSLAELSLSPVFRRKWSSVYEALQDCQPPRRELMKLYIEQIPTDKRIILAGDHTAYPRMYAPTLKDRTYEHGAKVISGSPVTLGHGYSTIAWIPQPEGSWALPLRHERITSHDSPLSKAAFQLQQVCYHVHSLIKCRCLTD